MDRARRGVVLEHDTRVHGLRMKNIILSTDVQLIEQARLLAKSRHNTLNAMCSTLFLRGQTEAHAHGPGQGVVKDWRVDVRYNIPLSRPAAPREEKVSTNFDLCNARHESAEGLVSESDHPLCRNASLRIPLPFGMVEQDHRRRDAPASGTLRPAIRRATVFAPSSAERAVGRG